MVATFSGMEGAELRAASYLKGWLDTGMLAGFRLTNPRDSNHCRGPGNSASLRPASQ
jgi:hypothetical protein